VSSGAFDLQNIGSCRSVPVKYVRQVDGLLDTGDVIGAETTLVRLGGGCGESRLVLSHAYGAREVHWDDSLFSGVSEGELRRYRLQGREAGRLTVMMSNPSTQPHDRGVGSDMELLSLRHYLLWRHALKCECLATGRTDAASWP